MDIDTSKIDFERAQMLLSLIEKQASVAPRATHLGAAAHSELMKLNDSIKVAAVESEKERRRLEGIPQHQMLDHTQPGNPTDADLTDADPAQVEEMERDPADPNIHPSGSRTATVADDNLRRI